MKQSKHKQAWTEKHKPIQDNKKPIDEEIRKEVYKILFPKKISVNKG